MSDSKKDTSSLYDLMSYSQPKISEQYVLYLRRSKADKNTKKITDRNTAESRNRIDDISIEQQRDMCTKYALQNNLKLVEEFHEVITAKNPDKRKEFDRMIEYLEQNPNTGILAWSPDRLSRNALEAGMLIQMFIEKIIDDFRFCTYYFHHDNSGLEHLLIEFARAMGYSIRLSATVKRGMHNAFNKKKSMSRPKFGYTRLIRTNTEGITEKVNFPVPHMGNVDSPGEFNAVQKAFELRIQGMSYQKIAEIINAGGYINKQNKPLKITKQKLSGGGDGHNSIGILKDTYYYGYMTGTLGEVDISQSTEVGTNGKLINFTPAVSQEDFMLCSTIQSRNTRPNTSQNILPFRGITKCFYCNKTITPTLSKENLYYFCGENKCPFKDLSPESRSKRKTNSINGVKLLQAIQKVFQENFKLTAKDMTTYLLYIEKNNKWHNQNKESNVRSYAQQMKAIDDNIDALDVKLNTALVELDDDETKKRFKETHKKRVAQLKDEKNRILTKKYILEKNEKPYTLDVEKWLELMKSLYLKWKKANNIQKSQIAENIFLELVIKQGKIASYKCKPIYSALEKSDLVIDGGATGT